MFGGPFGNWEGECQTCVPPTTADFTGAWWGWVDGCDSIVLTRLPEQLDGNTDWLEGGRLNVAHVTDSVALPNIVRNGTTYKCVGVSGSQIGDGSWAKGINGQVVWYQTNWRPVGDPSAPPVAGLARVRTAIGLDSPSSQSDPANHEFTLLESFLIDGTDGEPFRWDSADKLCYHFEHNSQTGYSKKTLVGPEYFVFQERRVGANKIRITYWEPGDPTPKVSEWDNPDDQENETGWPVTFFDAHAFPFGIASRCRIETFGDGELKRVDRLYRQGVCTVAGALGPSADDEANAGSVLAAGVDPDAVGGTPPEVLDNYLNFSFASFQRQSQDPGVPTLSAQATRVHFVDAVCHGSMQPHLTDNQSRTVEYRWYPDGWAESYGQGHPQIPSNYSYGFAAIVTSRGTHDPQSPNIGQQAHGPRFTLRDGEPVPGYSVFTMTSLFDENNIGAVTGLGVGSDGRFDYRLPAGPVRVWAAPSNATAPGQIGVYSLSSPIGHPAGERRAQMSISQQSGTLQFYGQPFNLDTEFSEDALEAFVYFATESAFANGYDTFGGDPLFTNHSGINVPEAVVLVEGSSWIPQGAPAGPNDFRCTRWLEKTTLDSQTQQVSRSHERLPQYLDQQVGGQFKIKGIWWDTSGEAHETGRLDWGGSLDSITPGFKTNPSPTPGL